jgi:hypothetical protein
MKNVILPVIAIVCCTILDAQAFYDPTIGRFASRDPIGENGGENLYGFVFNDSIDLVDMLGLDGLQYSSDGEYYVDANPFGANWGGDKSGKQASSDASFSQWVVEVNNNCNGGICNSSTPHPSSFVQASVKNTGKCPLGVTCSCQIAWYGSNTTYGPHKTGGFSTDGSILGKEFRHKFLPVNASDGRSGGNVWVASGAGTESQTQTFTLPGGASHQLYFGEVVVASPPNMPGAGFSAGMQGGCSCSAH